MDLILCLPFALQGTLMLVDEFVYHRRRGLGRWERLGHPLDTLTALVCLVLAARTEFTSPHLAAFIALGAFSCLFITKDEFVHHRECAAVESWLHSLLFVVHPVALLSAATIWFLRDAPSAARPALLAGVDVPFAAGVLHAQLALVTAFLLYQVLYWSFPWAHPSR
ncbi:MAG TPA: hypothetical protein VH877_04615 [Polyangia bacterium]|nr:hypothetical protein [Polyangia bacterium]